MVRAVSHGLCAQTAHDVLRELCGMLGLHQEEDLEEFGLSADLGRGR